MKKSKMALIPRKKRARTSVMKTISEKPLPSLGIMLGVGAGAGLTYYLAGKKKKDEEPLTESLGEKTYFDAAPRAVTGSHGNPRRGYASRAKSLFSKIK